MLQLWLFANIVLWSLNFKVASLTLNLNVVILIPVGIIWLWRKKKITSSSAKMTIALLSYMVFSLYIATMGPCEDKFSKSIITVPILTFLFFIGWEIGHRANSDDWQNLQRTAFFSLVAAFLGFMIEVAVPSQFPLQAPYRSTGKLSGLFQEPSHVAFSLFPCIIILLVSDKKQMRRRGIFFLSSLLLLSRSSTLIALIAVWFLYRIFVQRKVRQGVIFGLGILTFVGLAAIVDYNAILGPTVERVIGIVGSDSTDNLSSLVYLQGWEDTWSNLSRTHGLGLGFNMMGCHPLPDVPVRQILSLGDLEEINAEDASFQFGKIVSEAGVFGIAFYIVIIWWWLRLEKRINNSGNYTVRPIAATQAALIFCFIISSFIRGAGYFSAGILLWIPVISGARKLQPFLSTENSSALYPQAILQDKTSGTIECT